MTTMAARASRRRSRLINVFLGLLAALGILVLVLGGLGIWSVQRAFPETEGTLELSGLEQEVTVQRDAQGIPTITANTSHDIFMAQGFVHAQDRFWEMDFRRHMTSGRLSELFGASQLDTDKFLRPLDWHGIAEQEIEVLPDRERAYYEAYADGVNAYLAEREGGELALEYTVLGLQNSDYEPEPWTPVDSAAWLKAMAWDLRTNVEAETTRALLTQHIDEATLNDLYPSYRFDEHPVILAEDPDGSGIHDADIPAPAGNQDEPPDATSVSAHTASGENELLWSDGDDASPDPLMETIAAVDDMMPATGEGIGSNSLVVSGEHTQDRKSVV